MKAVIQLFIISLAWHTISAQVNLRSFIIKVTQDVWLERSYSNYNSYPFLLVGKHPAYPLKRTLMKFQDIPKECTMPRSATLHLFFLYAHKASWQSSQQAPPLPRYITAHTVLKSWSESQVTTTKRDSHSRWNSPWLNLGKDASLVAVYSTIVSVSPRKSLM